MESMFDFTIRTNKELSEKQGYELIHYVDTEEYSTYAGNRKSIGSCIIQAIRKDGKILNRVILKQFSTDFILNNRPTKSTMKTHQKKIEKALKGLFNVVEVNN